MSTHKHIFRHASPSIRHQSPCMNVSIHPSISLCLHSQLGHDGMAVRRAAVFLDVCVAGRQSVAERDASCRGEPSYQPRGHAVIMPCFAHHERVGGMDGGAHTHRTPGARTRHRTSCWVGVTRQSTTTPPAFNPMLLVITPEHHSHHHPCTHARNLRVPNEACLCTRAH